jgi:hypothetical protein
MVSPVLPSLINGNFWDYRNGLPGQSLNVATNGASQPALFTPNSHAGASFTSMQLSLAGGNQCSGVSNVRVLQAMLMQRGTG